jgi:hypothetical protein
MASGTGSTGGLAARDAPDAMDVQKFAAGALCRPVATSPTAWTGIFIQH